MNVHSPVTSAAQLLARLLQQQPADSLFARHQNEPRTLADLRQAVALASGALNTCPQQQIGLYFQDRWRFCVAFLALLNSGKTPVLLPSLQPGFIGAIAADVAVLLTDQADYQGPVPVLSLQSQHCAAVASVVKDDFFLYTSGSSGAPKKVAKQLSWLLQEARVLHGLWGQHLAPATTFYSTVSQQHIYGLLFTVLWPALYGHCIAAESLHFPNTIVAQIHPPALLVASPAQLARWPDSPEIGDLRGRLQAVFCSGGVLAPAIGAELARTLGRPVTEVYGSTETGGIAWRAITHTEHDSWQLLPGVEASLRQQQLWVRSPYTGATELATGDAATLSDQGELRLLGRIDSIAKIEGKRVSLQAIATALGETALVSEAQALVLAGRVAVAVALTEAGQQVLQEQGKSALVTQLKGCLAGYFEPVLLPRRWRFVAELPRNSQGKITAASIEDLF